MARARARTPWRLVPIALVALAGCQTGGTSVLTRWRMAHDETFAKGPTKDEIGDDRPLMARWLSPKKPTPSDPNKPPGLVLGPGGWNVGKVEPNPEADAEFRAAEKLFQQGNLELAEEEFAKLAKKRKDTPWGEKAQYYLAETQFQRGRFVKAHDSFEELLKTYNNTDYLDKLVAREYAIADKWLAQYDPSIPGDKKMSWQDRFTWKRPLVDTNGHAIQVLDHVRLHDPDGPLADDAAIRIADYYYKVGDFESASHYYDEMIRDGKKSPLLQRAQLSSIDAKLKDYRGPDYDGSGLEKAREMIKETQATFPDRDSEISRALYHDLDLITDQAAERTYRRGEYYQRTGHVISAEYYFAMIPQKWPNSPWASKAKAHLAVLAKMPHTESKASKILIRPMGDDPTAAPGGMNGMFGPGGMGGMGGMGGPGAMGMM